MRPAALRAARWVRGRVRRRPDVTVVVPVPVRGEAPLLGDCLDSLRAGSAAVEVVVTADPVSAAGRARGRYLAFVDPASRLAPDGLAAAVTALDLSGSAFAVGVHLEPARVRRDGWWAAPPAGPAPVEGSGLTALEALGLLTDLSAGDKVFRADWWRARPRAGVTGPLAADEVMAAYLAAPAFDAVRALRVTDLSAEAGVPVERQPRFDPHHVAARGDDWLAAARRLAAALPAAYDRWRALVVDRVLPGWYADAAAGGPPVIEALRPLVSGLVAGLPQPAAEAVRVSSRLAADMAAHGSGEDLALLLDHLSAHPAGLPHHGGLVDLPPSLTHRPPDAARRVGPADELLRSRVRRRPRTFAGPHLAVDCFVTYRTPTGLPSVQVARPGGGWTDAVVRRAPDPRLNEWAGRAFEDRTDAGFDVSPAPATSWQEQEALRVRVSLAGHRADHDLAPPPAPSPVPAGSTGPQALHVDRVRLDGDVLRLSGPAGPTAGEPPVEVRLEGPRGVTAWAPAQLRDGRLEAGVVARTTLFGDAVGLPAGGYRIQVRAGPGSDRPAVWSPRLLGDPPELVGARLALRLGAGASGAAEVQVVPPLDSAGRSAYGQQRWRLAYAAARGRTAGRTVLLETFRGRATGDNPGAVGRALRALDPGLDLVHVVADPGVAVPDGARAVARDTEEWYRTLAGAHAYVSNAVAPAYFAKKPGQVHVQTWHGTPLKRIGADRGPGDFAVWRHRRVVAAQARGWDALVSPSPFVTAILPRAFGAAPPVLEAGYPRNDLLVSADAPAVRRRVRALLGAGPGDRVVLYAPTWREYLGVQDAKPLYLDPHLLLRALPGSLVLVRGHYNATGQQDLFGAERRIRDVTRYPDVADLYLAADALVTDYSSALFDFTLTDKPIVLLVPDLERYRDVERGFYLDLQARAPGPLVRTTQEVADVLRAPDRHAADRAWFRGEYCPHDDGRAAARVAEHVLWLMARIP